MRTVEKKGFTIIEMLAVVVIVGLLTSVGVVSFLRSRQASDLERSASQLASNIRKIQGYTRTGRSEGTKVPRAYGLVVNLDDITGQTTAYTLYADFGNDDITFNDMWFDPGAPNPNTDVAIEQISLAANTVISGVAIDSAKVSYDRVDFAFFVPSSDLKAMGTLVGNNPPGAITENTAMDVEITVQHIKSLKTKTVHFTGGLLGGATVEDGS